MNILAVDDEIPALFLLEKAIREAAPDCSLTGFMSAKEALAYAENTQIDIAFLDIDMAGMNGLLLAKRLKDLYGKTNIVFVTGYSEYAVDAFSLAASGYVMKPVEAEAVARELSRLRDPVEPQYTERVRVNCFGSFRVFVDGEPLLFSRAKPKELLAYLIHKQGASVTPADAAAVLWEGKAYSGSIPSNMRNVIAQLMKRLREAGIEEIVRKGWNSMAVDAEKISCDYYDYQKGKMDSLNTYAGEYMSEYSWAEFTVGFLNKKAAIE